MCTGPADEFGWTHATTRAYLIAGFTGFPPLTQSYSLLTHLSVCHSFTGELCELDGFDHRRVNACCRLWLGRLHHLRFLVLDAARHRDTDRAKRLPCPRARTAKTSPAEDVEQQATAPRRWRKATNSRRHRLCSQPRASRYRAGGSQLALDLTHTLSSRVQHRAPNLGAAHSRCARRPCPSERCVMCIQGCCITLLCLSIVCELLRFLV